MSDGEFKKRLEQALYKREDYSGRPYLCCDEPILLSKMLEDAKKEILACTNYYAMKKVVEKWFGEP